ncbi:nuclease A inhibitor family protein [Pontibacter sp. E15-1]|uniref:nuclease A inhibitor family protein n=1 Tax=Pontibacter sp. E15-1 TaxID=2919918 RepID=UPI001F4FEC64|nr:nuclease A inhibitor family protein [Pontibacter sp. E15-1]MCJ8166287.1 nuclease A inhibitor family protein [Pontibacter sp. E15-1]
MPIEQIETELKQAANGLLMLSETDEPFEFYYDKDFAHEELNEETVLKMAGMPAQYPVEVVELDYFLRNQTRPPEETPDALARGERFQQLQAKLQDLLQDVKVYRVGETRITAYILGKTEDGEIAGLTTVVVET